MAETAGPAAQEATAAMQTPVCFAMVKTAAQAAGAVTAATAEAAATSSGTGMRSGARTFLGEPRLAIDTRLREEPGGKAAQEPVAAMAPLDMVAGMLVGPAGPAETGTAATMVG